MNTGVRDLPVDQRIRLVEEVWDSIAADQGCLKLSEAQRKELDQRLDALAQDGDSGDKAATVLERIRKQL